MSEIKNDLLIRQKCEAMIEYGHIALRQFPKSERHVMSAEIRQRMWEALRLRTNSKTQVFPVAAYRGRAVDFLGYRIWTTHRRMRKSSISRIRKTLKRLKAEFAAGRTTLRKIQQSVLSWVAHAAHADAYGLRKRLLGTLAFARR